MGIEIRGNKSNKMYLGITNPSDKKKEKGMFYSVKGEKIFVDNISGQLVNIHKKLNKPKDGHSWGAYWSYQFTFFDDEEDTQEVILDVRADNRITDSIVNCLASITTPHKIKLCCFVNKNGYLTTLIYNGKDQAGSDHREMWKYQWNAERGDFDEIPLAVKIPTGKDAEGNPSFTYDRTERNEFMDELIKGIYTVFSGKQWTSAQVVGDNGSNPTNHVKTDKDKEEEMKIIKGVFENFKNQSTLTKNWKAISERIKGGIFDYTNQISCVATIQSRLNKMGKKDYDLKIDGSYSILEKEPDMSDDLPF